MAIRTFISPAHAAHNPPAEYLHGHIVPYFEAPQRATILQRALADANLITIDTPPPISPDVLHTTHDPAMVAYLRDLSARTQAIIRNEFAVYDMQNVLTGDEYYYESVFPGQMGGVHTVGRPAFIYDSTSPVGRGTWTAALGAASAAYAGAEALLGGEQAAYALCRPPGHHAGRAGMGGYCYLNNAAVAANRLKASGRVAILDIDYHHGNGTQDIFWDDPAVLFVSLHADPALDYPHVAGSTNENHATNHNFPLPHGTKPAAYLRALDAALAVIMGFAPVALVVSLGFDIYHADPIGHFALDIADFTPLGARIAALKLPTLYVQEGGYNLETLADLAISFFRGVEGA